MGGVTPQQFKSSKFLFELQWCIPLSTLPTTTTTSELAPRGLLTSCWQVLYLCCCHLCPVPPLREGVCMRMSVHECAWLVYGSCMAMPTPSTPHVRLAHEPAPQVSHQYESDASPENVGEYEAGASLGSAAPFGCP